MTLLLFSAVVLFITATGPLLFGDVGLAITAFFTGVFGYFVFPLLLLVMTLSVMLIRGKVFGGQWVLRGTLLTVAAFFIVHTATAEGVFASSAEYGGYLGACFSAASEGIAHATGGGALFGLIVYPVRYALTAAGAYAVFSLLTAAALVWFLFLTPLGKLVRRSSVRKEAPAQKESRPTSFEDLPVPARTPMPAAAQAGGSNPPRPSYMAPQSYPAASTQRTSYPAASAQRTSYPAPAPITSAQGTASDGRQRPPMADPYARRTVEPRPAAPKRGYTAEESRGILFGGSPSERYRNNLIFDENSAFNRPRSSTLYRQPPVAERPAERPIIEQPAERPAERPAEASDYSGRFSEEAERDRAPLPRRIRSAPRDFSERGEELDYGQLPSYRTADPAPAIPEEPPKESRLADPAESRFGRLADPAESRFAEDKPEEPFDRSDRGFGLPERGREDFSRGDDLTRGREDFSRGDDFTRGREDFSRGDDLTRGREDFSRGDDLTRGREDFSRGETGFGGRLSDPAESRDFGREEPADPAPAERTSRADIFDDDEGEGDYRAVDGVDYTPPMPDRSERAIRSISDRSVGRAASVPMPEPEPEPMPAPAPAPAPKPKRRPKKYRRPALTHFEQYDDASEVSQEEIGRNSGIILDTLSSFRIEAAVAKVTCGARVTRYDIEIPKNVPVSMVTKRDRDIAMRLMVRDGVNMYVNNETGSVSIEVPNKKPATVGIRSILFAEEYTNAKPTSLSFALGKDIEGRNVCGDIVKMKHLLIAGSTGSGKSVCLNALLISLLCKYGPEDLRLILIDPKKVEFAVYDGIPHLMINEIITEAPKAVSALNWALKEMDRRYGLFEQKTKSGAVAIQNIDGYNENRTEDEEKLPKIVIVFDELADFMAVAKKDIEERIQRLTAKARAAGIHLVIATQRPSVDVITGVIKGNLPTRIAFRTIQEVDSRTILDESGAEKLLGNGDMLYRTEGMFSCLRVQGAYLSGKEIHDVIEDVKANNEAYFDEEVSEYINRAGGSSEGGAANFEGDGGQVSDAYVKALAVVVKLGQASISLIQRRCGVGYNHAGKIIEWMESMGYISPFDGKAKARGVLLTKEEFEAKYGPLE